MLDNKLIVSVEAWRQFDCKCWSMKITWFASWTVPMPHVNNQFALKKHKLKSWRSKLTNQVLSFLNLLIWCS